METKDNDQFILRSLATVFVFDAVETRGRPLPEEGAKLYYDGQIQRLAVAKGPVHSAHTRAKKVS